MFIIRETKINRSIDLSKLPRTKQGVDWKNSIGYAVPFIYDDIIGNIKIIKYDVKKRIVTVKYKNNEKQMQRAHIRECALGGLLGTKVNEYRYNVGDLVNVTNNNKLEILEQIRLQTDKGATKGYKYKCSVCGHIDSISEMFLMSRIGCNNCVGNDSIKLSNPNLLKLLLNKDDGDKYTSGSNAKVDFKCPDCGLIIRNKNINMVNNYGLRCMRCSDFTSYSAKYILDLLEQLNVYYEYEKCFDWSDSKRYDFYLPVYNCIIESNGSQHYGEVFTKEDSKTFEEEKENDQYKKDMALNSGIKYYISIDAYASNSEYLKQNILSSDLSKLYNLDCIDWNHCDIGTFKKDELKACSLWNQGNHEVDIIGKLINKSRNTVAVYVRHGAKVGICNFNEDEFQKHKYEKIADKESVPVICLNTGEVFKSQVEAMKKYNLKSTSHIASCCRGTRNSSGKDPRTGEKLKWAYASDIRKAV